MVNTHLKAFQGHEDKRKTQTYYILETEKRQMADKEHQKNLTTRPLIFCGDFNGNDTEEFCKAIYQNSSFKLADAYHRNKRRIHGNPLALKLHKRFVDYIFYSKQALHLTKYWALDILSVKKTTMTSLVYQSDHQSLVCEFQIGASLAH